MADGDERRETVGAEVIKIHNPNSTVTNAGPSLCSGNIKRKPSIRIRSAVQRMSVGELGCTYASLILHDDGIAITAEKISTLLKAANLTVESYWPSLFAKLCEKRNAEDLIMNVGSGGGGGAVAVVASGAGAAGGGAAAAAAPAVEEKKVEEKEESDDDMGFGLFD